MCATIRDTVDADLAGILFSQEEIVARVAALGATISADYAALGARELTLVGIANGAVVFLADLLRHLRLHTRLDTVRISSYQDSATPVARPQIHAPARLHLAGRHVLIIDDILDTGRTLAHLRDVLAEQHPASLRTCVLLDKKSRRQVPFEAEYAGFDIPDVFVVGYGLDFAERYRNLPCIGTLKPEKQNPANWER